MLSIIGDFIFFSIIGFIGEFFYTKYYKRKSGKALRGPWCPLYGLGGLTIYYATRTFYKNIFIIYILGVTLASIVEYTTSVVLEKIFKTRWWNYTEYPFNLNGRICLKNSCLFGILALILFYIYMPLKIKYLDYINPEIRVFIITLLGFIMFVDGLYSAFEATELKKNLELVEEEGLKNQSKLKEKLQKIKTDFSPKRLLERFDFNSDEKAKFLKKYYKAFKTKK